MRTLLVNPPLSDPAGPYPAIGYLAGYLRTIGRDAVLADASIEWLGRLFTRSGVATLAALAKAAGPPADPRVARFVELAPAFMATVDTAMACLRGVDQGATALARRPGYFPPPLDPAAHWVTGAYYHAELRRRELGTLTPAQRQRLAVTGDPDRAAFGIGGDVEAARFHASRLLQDLADVIRLVVDPSFALDAYAETLSDDNPTYDRLAERLAAPPTWLDAELDAVTDALVERHDPEVVGFSVPFPGNVYGALRMAARLKSRRPAIRTVMGGGYVNTQLRELSDPRIFDAIDYITLDDGERPLACLLEHVEGRRPASALCRTLLREAGRVVYRHDPRLPDVAVAASGTPTLAGLPRNAYLRYRPSVQTRQRFWGQRWNKLTLAHGCYWKRCAFCDTALDYIGRYQPADVEVIVARIRALIDETGQRAFHFVDEAMPPALLGRLADRLIEERLSIAWFGNARFDTALGSLAPRLARAGCVGITGGLETASARTMALIDKGVTLEQGAAVTAALAREGLFVHAYLIYGFPTQTLQETVDALEYVRQLFVAGAIHSAYWHGFGLTRYSPIARDPARFGIRVPPAPRHPFSNYGLAFDEPGRIDHTALAPALRRAATEYRLGIGLDRPVVEWFASEGIAVPAPTLPPDAVTCAIDASSGLGVARAPEPTADS